MLSKEDLDKRLEELKQLRKENRRLKRVLSAARKYEEQGTNDALVGLGEALDSTRDIR